MRWATANSIGSMLISVAVWIVPLADARGEVVTFTLDPSASRLDLSGFYLEELVSQDPPEDASLSTSYGGTVRVDVDDPASPTSIEFLDGAVAAENNGSWLPEVGGGTGGLAGEGDPGDPAPASYGMFVDVPDVGVAWGAFRDMVFTLFSEFAEPEEITNGMFNSYQIFEVAVGTLDSHLQTIIGDEGDSDDISGETTFNDAAKGSYLVAGNVATLTLPVDITFPGDLETRFLGTLVATATLGGELPGDFNNNGVLDAEDIDDLTTQSASQLNPSDYDLNDDLLVNEDDVSVWIRELFFSWIGDVNLDAVFDSNDLIEVLAANTYEKDVPAVWTTGDFNGDGKFSSEDLINALADDGYEMGERPPVAVNAVPEPLSIVSLSLGLLLVFARRRGG